ncbi:MAG: hypothetical protein M1817_003263 [Caeruleum heppii]|nr:MAG: hypothetical protein M1817_003263 [Caeruleum heppii]
MTLYTLPTEDVHFDPAVHLHSDPALIQFSNSSALHAGSDDLEAWHRQHQEATAAKNSQGIVIQHRAWPVSDVFRSEEDHPTETPVPKRRKLNVSSSTSPLEESSDPASTPPSSPPPSKMPLVSSPITYPPSSSPPVVKESLLRRDTSAPTKIGLFRGGLVFDDDEAEVFGSRQQCDGSNDVEVGTVGPAASSSQAGGDQTSNSAPPVLNTEPAPILDPEMLSFRGGEDYTPPKSPSNRFACREYDSSDGPGTIRTCSGRTFRLPSKKGQKSSFERMVATRVASAASTATKSYYGVDIHNLISETAQENEGLLLRPDVVGGAVGEPLPGVETPLRADGRASVTPMWTEKYRSRHFTELVGDERIHRSVLRWLKRWDSIVFPGHARPKPIAKAAPGDHEERPHRKILMLTGPPGLGKTTLAHVCARQAGYEVVEVNASDERSRDVVKGRIRDILGTENVRGVNVKTSKGNVRKAGRPVCVVVDEVDGVVTGSGASGEGGFIKALLDLAQADQKSSASSGSASRSSTKQKKGQRFRLLRPLILICNDVYHPSLRPLRQSAMAEIVHVRKAALSSVVSRLRTIFDKEGLSCDGDGVRRLCEATWGVSSRPEGGGTSGGIGEGDLRSVMVMGEWVAKKLRASTSPLVETSRLTREWVERHVLGDLSHGGSGFRSMGRGGTKEIVDRVFVDGAGFSRSSKKLPSEGLSEVAGAKLGVAEMDKKRTMDQLREMVEMCGDGDRVMLDCFSTYPSKPIQDDMFLSKPNAAYEWLHFHDSISSRVFSGQEWELMGYMSQPVLAMHQLFSSPNQRTAAAESNRFDNDGDVEEAPFSGPRADYQAHEAEKRNRTVLSSLQSSLPITLARSFRSVADVATDLLPSLAGMLAPDVKPVVVGGSTEQRGMASVRKESERKMVQRAVGVMGAVGIVFEKGRLESEIGGRNASWVYRMEPPLDSLATYDTLTSSSSSAPPPTRYAVRQVLDQEHAKHLLLLQAEARQARYRAGGPIDTLSDLPSLPPSGKENQAPLLPSSKHRKPSSGVKRDFFGRVVVNEARPAAGDVQEEEHGERKKRRRGGEKGDRDQNGEGDEENTVWVSFHEGFSNAVRKPISLGELMRGL